MYTADYQMSDFPNVYENVDGSSGEDNEQVMGTFFGFGNGVRLRSNYSQCMRKMNFVPLYQMCVYNPAQCPDGLTFSIWEKPYVSKNILNSTIQRQYILSTGGDDEGHPGIALYHDDHWLTVVVSTGSSYWKVSAMAAVLDGSWNNIGAIWKQSQGLQLYVNKTLTAQSFEENEVTPRGGLNPCEMIIGCQKTTSDPTYRHFLNGAVDEFAFWERALPTSDLSFFYGGYKDDSDAVTNSLLASYQNQVDMTDADQSEAFNEMLVLQVAKDEESPEEETKVTETVGNSLTTASPPENTTEAASAESIAELRQQSSMTMKSMGAIAPILSRQNLESFVKASSKLIDGLFDEEKSNAWRAIHANKNGTPSVMQLVDRRLDYFAELVRRTAFNNESEAFCTSIRKSNLREELCKTMLSKMKGRRTVFKGPTYDKKKDENRIDRVEVSPGMFEDSRCDKRGVSHSISIYNSISSFIDKNVVDGLDPNLYLVDSRIFSFRMSVDYSYDSDNEFDTSKHLCVPNPTFLKKNPVKIVLETLTPVFPRRKILFHELYETDYSNIETRSCAWWNNAAGDAGAWDTEGCQVIQTMTEFTKCTCDRFGTYAVIAKKTEGKVIPLEPTWFPFLKFVLYGFSALALLIYIIVVTISGTLKDQLHVMGLNLAICLLVGSIAMVLTDLEDVTSDRHICVAIGTLIHFFYGAAGFWMFGLGHATFKAITAGVIQGLLKCYMFLCWGLALISMGIPFVAFLQELGTDPRCFISWEDSVKLFFFGPQTVCSLAAIFFAIVILTNLSNTLLRKDNLIEDYKSFSRGTAFLFLLLGVTWMFGSLAYIRLLDLDLDSIFTIFQILNSVAGIALLLCIGIVSNRFRGVISCQARKMRQKEDAPLINEDKSPIVPETSDKDTKSKRRKGVEA